MRLQAVDLSHKDAMLLLESHIAGNVQAACDRGDAEGHDPHCRSPSDDNE
jgi:hypothetical protein